MTCLVHPSCTKQPALCVAEAISDYARSQVGAEKMSLCRCFIYRMLATGLIDEKVFQRQLYKGGLSGVVGDCSGAERPAPSKAASKQARGFSKEELRKLFSMNEDTECDTRDTLSAANDGGMCTWTDARASLNDPVLQAAVDGSRISFAWLESARGEGADAIMPSVGCTELHAGDASGQEAEARGAAKADRVDDAAAGGCMANSGSDSDDWGTHEGGSVATGDLAQAMDLCDSDADDAAAAQAPARVLVSD